jgi:hypothetical protein
MPLTDKQRELASQIDRFVRTTPQQGGGDEALLVRAFDYMPAFKQLVDMTSHAQLLELCTIYPGFFRFAKLLEQLAQGIQDGKIDVPPQL